MSRIRVCALNLFLIWRLKGTFEIHLFRPCTYLSLTLWSRPLCSCNEHHQKLLEKRRAQAPLMSRPHTSSGSPPSNSSSSLYNSNNRKLNEFNRQEASNGNYSHNDNWADRRPGNDRNGNQNTSADRFSKTLPARPSAVQELPLSKGPQSDLEKRLEMQRSRRRRQ